MKITKRIENGNSLVIALEGRLDTATAPDLEQTLKGIEGGYEGLVFDFANLDYISSAGLRVLLMAKKSAKFKGNIKILNASEIVKEVFDVTGFSDMLDIE